MIGTEEEKKALDNLQNDLDWLKKNIKAVGSVDLLKAKYPKGYKKIMDKIEADLEVYTTACFRGYRADNEVLDTYDLKEVWGNNGKKISRIIKTSQDAKKIQKVYEDYLLRLQELFKGLIFVSLEDIETKEVTA